MFGGACESQAPTTVVRSLGGVGEMNYSDNGMENPEECIDVRNGNYQNTEVDNGRTTNKNSIANWDESKDSRIECDEHKESTQIDEDPILAQISRRNDRPDSLAESSNGQRKEITTDVSAMTCMNENSDENVRYLGIGNRQEIRITSNNRLKRRFKNRNENLDFNTKTKKDFQSDRDFKNSFHRSRLSHTRSVADVISSCESDFEHDRDDDESFETSKRSIFQLCVALAVLFSILALILSVALSSGFSFFMEPQLTDSQSLSNSINFDWRYSVQFFVFVVGILQLVILIIICGVGFLPKIEATTEYNPVINGYREKSRQSSQICESVLYNRYGQLNNRLNCRRMKLSSRLTKPLSHIQDTSRIRNEEKCENRLIRSRFTNDETDTSPVLTCPSSLSPSSND